MEKKITESQLREIIAENVRVYLKEGTSDSDVIRKWNYLLGSIGAEKMLELIFKWSDDDRIEKWVEWFEEEGYLPSAGRE